MARYERGATYTLADIPLFDSIYPDLENGIGGHAMADLGEHVVTVDSQTDDPRYAVAVICAPKCAILHGLTAGTARKVRRINHIHVGPQTALGLQG